MDLDSVAAAHHGAWNETERSILAYLLQHQREVAESSVHRVAERTFTSASSVMRLTKKLGFSGFAELKYFIRTSLAEASPGEGVDLLAAQREDLEATMAQLERVDLEPIVRRIHESSAVYCLGTGFAQRTAVSEFSKSLLTNGKSSSVIPDLTELRVGLPMMKPEDLMVLVSLSGDTPDYAEIPQMLALRGIPTLAVTRLSSNRMSAQSQWSVHYCASPITLPWHPGPFYSFVGLNLTLDHLVRRYMIYRLGLEQGGA